MTEEETDELQELEGAGETGTDDTGTEEDDDNRQREIEYDDDNQPGEIDYEYDYIRPREIEWEKEEEFY